MKKKRSVQDFVQEIVMRTQGERVHGSRRTSRADEPAGDPKTAAGLPATPAATLDKQKREGTIAIVGRFLPRKTHMSTRVARDSCS